MPDHTAKLAFKKLRFVDECGLPPTVYQHEGKLWLGVGDLRSVFQFGLDASVDGEPFFKTPIPFSVDAVAHLQMPLPSLRSLTFPDDFKHLPAARFAEMEQEVEASLNESFGPKISLDQVVYFESREFGDRSLGLLSEKCLRFVFKVEENRLPDVRIESLRFEVNERAWFRWQRNGKSSERPHLGTHFSTEFLAWFINAWVQFDDDDGMCDVAELETCLASINRGRAQRGEAAFDRATYVDMFRKIARNYWQTGDQGADPGSKQKLWPECFIGGKTPRRWVEKPGDYGKVEYWDLCVPISVLALGRINSVRVVASNSVQIRAELDAQNVAAGQLSTSFCVPFKIADGCYQASFRAKSDLFRLYTLMQEQFRRFQFGLVDRKTGEKTWKWVQNYSDKTHLWWRYDVDKAWWPSYTPGPLESPNRANQRKIVDLLSGLSPGERHGLLHKEFVAMFGMSYQYFANAFSDAQLKGQLQQLLSRAEEEPVEKIEIFVKPGTVGKFVVVQGVPKVKHSYRIYTESILGLVPIRDYNNVYVDTVTRSWLPNSVLQYTNVDKPASQQQLPEHLRASKTVTVLRPVVNVAEAVVELDLISEVHGIPRAELSKLMADIMKATLLGEHGQTLINELLPDIVLPSFQVPMCGAEVLTIRAENLVAAELSPEAPGFLRFVCELRARRSLWLDHATPSLFGKVGSQQQILALKGQE